jgi:hypothetical protein
MKFEIGDFVQTSEGKGRIVHYSNWVYTVEIKGKKHLFGVGELEKV